MEVRQKVIFASQRQIVRGTEQQLSLLRGKRNVIFKSAKYDGKKLEFTGEIV